MRHFTLVTLAILMAAFGFKAKAQEEESLNVYISGAFNGYNPDGNEEYALQAIDEDETAFRGEFDIPAGQFTFNLQYAFGVLVPAVENEDGDFEVATANVPVLGGDNFFTGKFTTFGGSNVYWENANWEGGKVEITVDFLSQEIMISVDGEEVPDVPAELFIAGEFNDYAPEGLEIWSLGIEEDGTSYRGTFNIPAGQFKFNIQYGTFTLVPGVEGEEGDYVASEADVTVLEGDDFYSGKLAPTGTSKVSWVNNAWEGGKVEVTVDLVNDEIILSTADEEGPVEGSELYIAGEFNGYAPEGLEIWSLSALEDGVSFRGTFEIPAGQFKFNVQYGTFTLVPGVEEAESGNVPATENVAVLEGDDFFSGKIASTGTSELSWVNNAWEGGKVEVTVNLEEAEIAISAVGEEGEGPVGGSEIYIAGEFNNFAPEGLEIWSLTALEDGVSYRGTFEIPEKQFAFYVQYGQGALVPGVANEEGDIETSEADVEVLVGDDFYSGKLASTGVARYYWINQNWEGGLVEVTVNLEEEEIAISAVSEEGPVGGSELYISGEFNDYAPEGLEIWSLTALEDGVSFRGTFDIPAGQFKFNVQYGTFTLVPGVEEEENGNVPATENVTVLEGDDFFSGKIASTGTSELYWVNENWEGGLVEVTVDLENAEIILSSAVEAPETPSEIFIAGEFNEYNPDGLEIWSLGALEDGTSFRGTFEIPAGEFSFYVQYGTFALVPAVENAEGEIEAATENVNVLDGDDFYSGKLTSTGLANAYWVNPTWEGGKVEVTIDLENEDIIISAANGEEPGFGSELYIAGAFNEYDPAGEEIWSLGALEDGTSFRGTFEIPAGQFSFHILYGTFALVPAVENAEGETEPATADVTVLDGDVFFSGKLTSTGVANANWVNSTWEGGLVEVTVDLENEDIIISLSEEPAEAWYIRGPFNSWNPAGNVEWQLLPSENADENGIYTGVFNIPEGEFEINIMGYDNVYVPAALATEEVVFANNVFTGHMDMAYDLEEASYAWTVPAWAGGKVKITVDANEGTITIEDLEGSGINAINAANGEEVIFNLNGVRVDRNKLDKGVYIINGKKVIL